MAGSCKVRSILYNAIRLTGFVSFQSSYGKDALSLYLIREDPSKNEMKIGTKIGYLNYLHTIETYWNGIPDGQKGYLDVHVDK